MVIIIFGWIVVGTMVGLAIMQSVYVWLHCRFLRSEVSAKLYDLYKPKVAIVLCVRGTDPSLAMCLAGLTRQVYEDFEIHIVADNPDDSALQTVKDFFADKSLKPTIHILKDHAKSRSLKCSSIIAAVSELDASIEVVALIDADAIADPNWLKDLVAPLGGSDVGVTTGNRWFAPSERRLGSEVRQIWNAAAVPQATAYQVPWGGSLAIKISTIEKCQLLDHWANAFCEDTMLTNILKAKDLRMVRVPNLILSNDESTSLRSTFHWVIRQLLTVRLYHRDWPLVVLHGLSWGACLIAVFTAITLLFFNNEPYVGMIVVLSLLFLEASNCWLYSRVQAANLRAIDQRGSATNTPSAVKLPLLAILLTQFLYPVAVLAAATTKRVSWRGVEYAIGPGKKVAMNEYRRYQEPRQQNENSSRAIRSIE